MAFTQLGEVRAHRSVLKAMKHAGATCKEQIHTSLHMPTKEPSHINDVMHIMDSTLETESKDELKVWAYIMTQCNLKPGLCKFGARGSAAAMKELTQLHIMDTWEVMNPMKLGQEEKMKALLSLLFLKEKQMEQMKGRACINGAPQRAYISKEKAASPTMSTESTFITSAKTASENRKVRCYDVPSAFINTKVDEDVMMVLKGKLAMTIE